MGEDLNKGHNEGHNKGHKQEYLWIFFILFVLTVVEIAIPEMGLGRSLEIALLIFLASLKAFCVAYWFMHLKQETAWLKFIAAVPISAAIYTTVVLADALFR